MSEPRTYTTTTGEQLPLPARFGTPEAPKADRLIQLSTELGRIDAELAEIEEQRTTQQRRRAELRVRRRSLLQLVAHLKTFNPSTPEE